MTDCAIYARSSPDYPYSAEEQIVRLQVVASERAWTVTHVFNDRPSSVKKRQDRRPGEAALLAAIRSGAVQCVLVQSIDRLGRTLPGLLSLLEACRVAGVSVWLTEQGISTDQATPLLDAAAMFALHLRHSRRDGILRGQMAARALSIRFGRPPISPTKTQKALHALVSGKGVRETARLTGISPTSISRIKARLTSEAAG